MKTPRRSLALAVVAFSGAIVGQADAGRGRGLPSFLPAAGFDVVPVLQPAPVPGDIRYDADREIFRRTRALKDTPRWAVATSDVSEKPADMMKDFSCAAGVELSPDRQPRLAILIEAASADTARVNNAAKNHFRRARPFTIDPGPICQPAKDVLNSFDYPSGHTTRGWTWALILAQVLPEQASAILARGRAYGESRIVCGVHNASAVEAGRLSAGATMTVIERNASFQRDLRAVAREVSHSRALDPQERTVCARSEVTYLPSVVR